MDAYRPPMPPNQLCPVCMAPHFPFCPPNHTYAAPFPRREPFYPGQSTPHLQYEPFHQHPGQPYAQATYAMQAPVFRGGNATDYPPKPSYFPQVPQAHFVDDRKDRFSQVPRGQFQSAEPFFPDAPNFSQPGNQYHSSNGSMAVDFSRQGGSNSWMEAERGFSLQQQRQTAGMGDGIGSGEGFPSKVRVLDLPRMEATVSMSDDRFERGFRGDFQQTPGDARFEREKHNIATDSFTGAAKGRNQFVSMRFPNSSLTNMGELQENKGSTVRPADFANYPYTIPGSFNNAGAQAPQSFGSGPGLLNAMDEFSKREERSLAEHKLLAHQAAKREDDIPHGPLPLENNERNEDVQEGVDYAFPKKNLKRKHPMSREEELLIEKGLIDDDYSEPHMRKPFSYQGQQGSDHFVTQSKQGDLREKEVYYDQAGYRSSTNFSERELKGGNLGQRGEFYNQRIQPLISQNERNRKEEFLSDRCVDGKGADGWPSQGSLVKNVPGDGPKNSGKPLSLDSLCSGALHHASNQLPEAHHQQFEEAQRNKDILYRQYQEWEAEEKHIEALKKAESLAREIQQREEVVHPSSSSHPAHFHRQDLLQENIRQVHEHRGMFRSGAAETTSDVGMPQHATRQHGLSSKHPALQHPSSYADIQEPQWQEQQQLREDGFALDLHNAQPFAGLQSQRDGLTRLPGSSQSWHDNHSTTWNMSRKDQPYQQPDRSKEHQSGYEPHLGPQHNQLMPHHDQKWTSSHSFFPQYGAQDFSQKASGKSTQHSLQYQPMLGAAHDLHGSKPPLPVATSVHPPPPESPPPPPPPARSPESVTPPPPPPSTTFPSARSSTLQGLAGHSQDYLKNGLPSDGHNYGPMEVHPIHQPGVSQVHMLNHHHYQSQLSQQVDKLKVVDAMNIFRNPGRQTRPDRFVVILRGIPGSGKSYLAKAMRDVEVMNGGSAPRIHSIDDYFTCEVEKEEEVEMGSSGVRAKKKVVKRVIEYCYEPEMEEAYRASMVKAFRKTLDEGRFKFVIVDDRNVVIADFAQFWAIAKRSGYEAFVLEAPYSDVKGCTARNVHNFTEQQIQSMADRWESTPSLYLKLDVSSLFRADDLNAQDIIEVDMDADDMERDLEDDEEENDQSSKDHLLSSQRIERPTTGDRWEDKNDTANNATALSTREKKPLEFKGGRERNKQNVDNALSGLMTTYGKKDKFVHWSDNQGVKGSSTGFSIGVSQRPASLVIGPGPGYNGMSNLMVEGDDDKRVYAEVKKSNKFVEQLRAEQEAFKAVFARRRQRIRGMDDDDDD